MSSQTVRPSLDRLIARLASRQFGVISRAQLLGLGAAPHQIDDRLRAGHLVLLHRGVYAVGHAVLRAEGHWLAAVLSAGDGAVLSHRSAAALWDLRREARAVVDVLIVRDGGRARRRGVAMHRTTSLPPHERTTRLGIPVTSPARTLLDIADVLQRHQLDRALEQAEQTSVFDLTAIERVIREHPGRKGGRRLAVAVDEQFGDTPLTRSDLEARMRHLCRAAGLPEPHTNHRIAGVEADFAWPDLGVVVEIDSFRIHGTHAAFERDRRKDADLTAAGLTVLRYTDRAVEREEERIRATLAATLRARTAPRSDPR